MTDASNDSVLAFIEKTVADYPVVLFMKGVPDRPQCGFSNAVVQILDHLDVDYVGVNVPCRTKPCARASRTSPTGPPSPSSM